MLSRVWHVGVVLSATLLCSTALAACGSSSNSGQGTRYVALGDSSVAGAGINRSTGVACPRSNNNWPSLVARSFHVDTFVDVSCPGATTHDILHGQNVNGVSVGDQISAITPAADVVTISIGGNDGAVVPGLYLSCYVPPNNTATACHTAIKDIPKKLVTTQKNIVNVLAQIKKRAPRALVVLVGYLRIMPDSGSCKTIPISSTNLELAANAEAQIEGALKAAAGKAHASYVSMRDRSKSHGACAAEAAAWVNSLTPAPGDGTYLHPRAVGMKAVAKAVGTVVSARLAN